MYEIVSCQRMLTVVLKESQKLIQKVLPPYRFEAIKNRKENIHCCEKKGFDKTLFFSQHCTESCEEGSLQRIM